MPTRASRITFFVIFAITGLLFYRTMRPLFLWVGVAAFCAVLSYNPYLALTRKLGGRKRIAAALCTFGVFLLVIGPLIGTGYAIVDEGLDLAQKLQEEPELTETQADGLPAFVPEFAREWIASARELAPVSREQVRAAGASAAQTAVGTIGGVVTGITNLGIGIFLWILTLFYFYVDGERWLKSLQELLPLPERHSSAFFREFRSVAHAVFFGNIVTAIAQGVLGGIAFMIVGLPGAVLYGSLIALAGVLPLIGAILVWGPAGIYLLMQGRIGAGIFMIAWGVLVVGTVDNVLRPILTKGGLRMHPLLVFLSLFGGISAFGFPGLLLGPLFAALFMAAVRIYASEFPPRRPVPPPAPETTLDVGLEAAPPIH